MIITMRLFGWTTFPDPILVATEVLNGQLYTWWRPDAPRFLLDLILLGIECFGLIFSAYLFVMFAGALDAHFNPRDRPVPLDEKNLPLVSVLIPTCNDSLDIVMTTLKAIMNQNYSPKSYEVLLIDNGDDQNLSKLLEEECKVLGVQYHYFFNIKGFKAAALNYGLKRSSGEFILVLDADQVPVKNLIRVLIEGFDSSNVAYTVSKVRFRNTIGIISKANAMLHLQFYEVIELSKNNRGMVLFAGTSGCFRKKYLMEIGGFREETLIEDIDTSSILLSQGYSSRLISQVGSWGLAPMVCRQQVSQLWRWAHGATSILRWRTKRIISSDIPIIKRIELLLDVSSFLAGLATLFFTVGIALLFLDNSRPFRPYIGSFPLYLIMPLLFGLGYAGQTFQSLVYEKSEHSLIKRITEIPPFYILSFAAFPFLISAVLQAFFSREQPSKQHIPWNPETAFWRNAFIVFTLGLFLFLTGIIAVLRFDFGVAILFITMALCCLVPLPLCTSIRHQCAYSDDVSKVLD